MSINMINILFNYFIFIIHWFNFKERNDLQTISLIFYFCKLLFLFNETPLNILWIM